MRDADQGNEGGEFRRACQSHDNDVGGEKRAALSESKKERALSGEKKKGY